LGKEGKGYGNKSVKEKTRRKEQDFPPPLNPTVRLAILSIESSVEESGRLPAHHPSNRQRPALLAGGNDQDEGDYWDQAAAVSQATWPTSEPVSCSAITKSTTSIEKKHVLNTNP
jgi:hypothetical protein